MSEEQVREPGAPYTAPTVAEADEHLMQQLQAQVPPYFDRFLEERDRRIASKLHRLEAAVEHNGAEIARVLREMDRRFTEVKKKGQESPQADMEALRTKTRTLFHWVIGLELVTLVEIVILTVRLFFVGTF